MDMFHNSKSSREKGTLANIRVIFGHKNVMQDTKKCFNATFEFIEFVTTSYVLALVLYTMKVVDIKTTPVDVPTMVEDKLLYLSNVAEKVLIKYIFQYILQLFLL